ncbi:MAG: hypothetical protein ACOYVJ_06230 [Nitrospirota bacterium]
MLVGYNTNISYRDTVYHIQTEDSGQNNPVIVTLLYAQGAILASKKTSYAHFVNDPDFKEKARDMMKKQHKVMIKELLSGKYSGGYREEEAPEAVLPRQTQPAEEEQPPAAGEKVPEKIQATHSLDDILLNYILKRNT